MEEETPVLLQVPATVTKVSSMANRSVRVQVDSNQNLSDEQMASIMKLHEKYGHFCFLAGDREIDVLDIINLPPLKAREEDKKSPGQRLRAALFVLWKQLGEHGDFESFYYIKMERFIDAVKEKLT